MERKNQINAAVITANTFGEGNASNLTISNAELVKLSGEGSGLFTQVGGETTVGEVRLPSLPRSGMAYPTPYTRDRPFPHPVNCPRKK